MELNGANVRDNFDLVTNGVKHAVDYLRQNFNAQTLANLPFVTMLVPLAVFFAVPGNREASYNDDQRKRINRWFWRTAFSRRYSSGVLRNLKTDIAEMVSLRDGKSSALGDFDMSVDADFFLSNNFSMGNVNTKTFLLLLATKSPKSFISGQPINLAETLKAANRSEFHHMMPKDFIRKSEQFDYSENALANLCFLSRTDNRKLGGQAPSKYRALMPENDSEVIHILDTAVTNGLLFTDNYRQFLEKRASDLTLIAKTVCEI